MTGLLDPATAPTPSEVAALPTPTTEAEWLERARLVRRVLETDAAERDHDGRTPHAEVALLKDSGLVTVLGPREHGGAGLEWPAAYRIVREVAAGDGSVGQLLGYHYLWFWAARLVGTPEQIAAVEEQATRNQWFFGGAVNPRDEDVVITDEGDELVYRGKKSFSTGSKVSDVTVLEGVVRGTGTHVFAIVPSDQPAITFHDDWDNIGQRLTESGSVTIDGVRVPWSDAAGFRDKQFTPRVYNTMNVPVIQLVFVSFYLGIARGCAGDGGRLHAHEDPAVAARRAGARGRRALCARHLRGTVVAALGGRGARGRGGGGGAADPPRPGRAHRAGARRARGPRRGGEGAGHGRGARRHRARSSRSSGPGRRRRAWRSTGSGATSGPTRCTTRWPTSAARSGPTC